MSGNSRIYDQHHCTDSPAVLESYIRHMRVNWLETDTVDFSFFFFVENAE
jgi:hypothetical protein